MIEKLINGDTSRQFDYTGQSSPEDVALPFIITNSGNYTCDSTYYHKRKNFNEGLILYTLEGEGFVKYRGQRYPALPGQIFVINCNEYQHYGTAGNSWHFLWIHFKGVCAFSYIDMLNKDSVAPIDLEKKYSFEHFFNNIRHNSLQVGQKYKLKNALLLHELLNQLIQTRNHTLFSHTYDRHQDAIKESIAYISSHYKDNISIRLLAERCSMSNDFFIRVFKAYTAQTPYEYLLLYRLQQSKKLLLESNGSVSQIAQEIGFSDSKRFITCFKNKIGITPLQYRKQNRI